MSEKGPSQAAEPMPALDSKGQHEQGQHEQGETPPSYSENTRAPGSPASTWGQQLLATPGLPDVNVLAYLPPKATLSSNHTTVTVRDEQLATVPAALASFIVAQAALPPRPILRIEGSILGDTEFDLKIDMMRYFMRKGDGPAWNYIDMVGKDEVTHRGEGSASVEPHCNTLLEWAQRFVDSPAGNKSFVLTREFPNWNTQLLEGRIRTLLASLVDSDDIDEIEDLTVSFSATHTHVVVLPPQTSVVNQVLSILSTVKKFAVVRAVWPYANTATEQPNGVPRQCAVQSEDDWWRVWRPIITTGVLSRKKGWLGIEDLMDTAMCPGS